MGKNKADRFLSLVLRHKPEEANIKLDKNGWTDVEVLIENISKKGYDLDMSILEEIVSSNDKQRFAFNDDKTRIRASQGHSVKVDLKLKAQRPPDVLYHGTVKEAIAGIFSGGLQKVKRHAVHLSHEKVTATAVGGRRGNAIILEINSRKMYADGIKFYKSENGVWLVDEVPSEYIKQE